MEGTNPVNKKLAAALSGGAVLVLALSGCSSDDGSNDKLSQSGNDALAKLEEGDVGKAMAEQESCKSASTAPSASKA